MAPSPAMPPLTHRLFLRILKSLYGKKVNIVSIFSSSLSLFRSNFFFFFFLEQNIFMVFYLFITFKFLIELVINQFMNRQFWHVQQIIRKIDCIKYEMKQIRGDKQSVHFVMVSKWRTRWCHVMSCHAITNCYCQVASGYSTPITLNSPRECSMKKKISCLSFKQLAHELFKTSVSCPFSRREMCKKKKHFKDSW